MLEQETAPSLRRDALGGRILVVDDDRDVARLVSTVLEEAGHEVKAITDARQAMETFNEFRPDLVTLDVLMPAVDGISRTKFNRAFSISVGDATRLGPNRSRIRARTVTHSRPIVLPRIRIGSWRSPEIR